VVHTGGAGKDELQAAKGFTLVEQVELYIELMVGDIMSRGA
jgi:hypothetical protein